MPEINEGNPSIIVCDPVAAQTFKEARIDAAIVINQQRNNYFKTKLQRVAGNPRETYRVINHPLNKDHGKTKYPCGFDPEQTAEKFKKFLRRGCETHLL